MIDIVTRIAFRTSDFLVVDKPPGLVSAGPPHHLHGEPAPRQSVESLLSAALRRRVWAVHQLDRQTSGLNLFALKSSLVAPLAERLKVPGAKTYLAIAHGHVPAPTVIDVPLTMALDPKTGKTEPAVADAASLSRRPPNAPVRPSLTRIISALHNDGADLPASFVTVILETGRQHQVRLHLAHLGHPLIGERLHRSPPCTLHDRHALHAHALTWDRTTTLPALAVTSPLPPDLVALAARLGLRPPPHTLPPAPAL